MLRPPADSDVWLDEIIRPFSKTYHQWLKHFSSKFIAEYSILCAEEYFVIFNKPISQLVDQNISVSLCSNITVGHILNMEKYVIEEYY